MSIFSDIGFLIGNFPQIEACFEQGEQAVRDGTATYNDLMAFAAQAVALYRSFQAVRVPAISGTSTAAGPTPSAPSVTADDLNAQELQQIEALTKSQAWSR